MTRSNTKLIIIAMITLVAVLVGIWTVLPPTTSKGTEDEALPETAFEKATYALRMILAEQADGALASGTVIQVGKNYFVYNGKHLCVTQETPDTSFTFTRATVAKNGAAVYLSLEDGLPDAFSASETITYNVLFDSAEDAIETYEYCQENPAASKFWNEVSYKHAADTVSEIAKYTNASERYDRPLGYTITLQAGELTVYDNGSQSAYTVAVEEGPYTFYNITPGVGGEFWVMQGDTIVQKGHLRPSGTIRMIYSDTPGLQNMRDLGGLACDGGTIKYNLLIRGGMIINATDADRNTWVKLLDIKHEIFVKTYYESQLVGKEEYRNKSPLGDDVTFYQNDLSAEDLVNKRSFAHAKEQMNGIINHLFDNAIAGEATYFHCLAGADRTGMVAIIVEGVLGVSKSDIDKDYELTSFNCLRERNGVGYLYDINILRSYPGETFRDKCIAYLLDCGIAPEKINAFRNAVIDGIPEQVLGCGLEEEPTGVNLAHPNGDGWIDNGRSSTDGEGRTDATGYILTNYFQVQNGDIVYVKNLRLSSTLYSGIYRANKNRFPALPCRKRVAWAL